jgi:hypothetical protein
VTRAGIMAAAIGATLSIMKTIDAIRLRVESGNAVGQPLSLR